VAAEPHAVEEIITRCARLPLALTITAAHAAQSGFSLATLAAELARTDRRLDALSAGDVVKPGRRGALLILRNTDAEHRARLRLLGLHPGPDISAAAEASLAYHGAPGPAGCLVDYVHV
jgi:hypothetical protein